MHACQPARDHCTTSHHTPLPARLPACLQPPSIAEGFERVHVVRSFEDAAALLRVWGATPPPPPPPPPQANAAMDELEAEA